MSDTTPSITDPSSAALAVREVIPDVEELEATRRRVVIEHVAPSVGGGRFPAKASVGEPVRVEADLFADGHDRIAAVLRHRFLRASPASQTAGAWHDVEMVPGVNDRWSAEFVVHSVGLHEFTIIAWIDRFGTWRADLAKRVAAQQDVNVDLQIGAGLIDAAAQVASRLGASADAHALKSFAAILRCEETEQATEAALGDRLCALMRRRGAQWFPIQLDPARRIWVDRALARFSAWYELFPRSASPDSSRSGTLADVENRLDAIAGMGFDVLYLPPIHPIGRAFRKGRNNAPRTAPGDVGSPWAIGGVEGGHDAIHPDLGTFEDFGRLVKSAGARGIEIALDLAFQCSPDHPYVAQHPQWFRHRPDGTIQYAENPPKKYQDIIPFDFECDDFRALWHELLRVTLFWHARGVRIFRVDNPHTKPFAFWEWFLERMRWHDPNVLFLAEAFTRPKVMYRLAKLGFTQSYTYFTWRNDPQGIRKYFTELTTPPVADFFRASAWPTTPDILSENLQTETRAAWVARAVLAATLCANFGIYGPAFELMEHRPAQAGGEEYLNSEKYEIRHWDSGKPSSLAGLLTVLNQVRKGNPALQYDRGLVFHISDNPTVLCYSKSHGDNAILVVVNTDAHNVQWARLTLDLKALGVPPGRPFQVHDLLSDARYRWQGERAIVGLDPGKLPAHLFLIRRHQRTENDFEYFL